MNNASSFYPTPVGDITALDWDDLIGTNLKAPLFLSQAAAPLLHAARGLIVNLADIHGLKPLRRYPVYSVAKAGLIMLTKSLARELAPHVRVNAVAPGPVMWPEDGLDPALQRLHAEDLSGILIEADWPRLVLPAIATDASTTTVEWPSEKNRPTVTGRFFSCISLRVTLSIAAIWSASTA